MTVTQQLQLVNAVAFLFVGLAMLVLTLLTLLIATPLYSSNVSALQQVRLTAVALMFAAYLALNCYYPATLSGGVSLYSGLFIADAVTPIADAFICLSASLALMP